MNLLRLTVLAVALCLVAVSAPLAGAAPRLVTPHQACSGLGLSHQREAGERRSAFNACVVAAARGTREGEEGATAS